MDWKMALGLGVRNFTFFVQMDWSSPGYLHKFCKVGSFGLGELQRWRDLLVKSVSQLTSFVHSSSYAL